jgi:hypothetical protein
MQPDSRINKPQSPSTYKPWTTSIHLSQQLNYSPLTTYGPPHIVARRQLSSALMDYNNLASPNVRVDENSELSPLLYSKSGNRSYQAYCVTEASSRPPSPDRLMPRPLCIQSSPGRERQDKPRAFQDHSFAQSLMTNVQQDRSLSMSSTWKNAENGEETSSSQICPSQSTVLVDDDHITPAVTPRGSHPLAAGQTSYDQTLSHSRMQQTSPAYVATPRAYQRKPLPHSAVNAIIEPRPLPPLPLEVKACHDLKEFNSQPKDVQLEREDLNQTPQQSPNQPWTILEHHRRTHPPTSNHNKEDLLIPSKGEDNLERQFPRSRVMFQAEIQSHSLQRPHGDIVTRESGRSSLQSSLVSGDTQFPSLADMYVSRGLLSDMDDDRRAYRRTQPKDPKFKYPFGRRPSVRLDKKPPTPPHRLIPKLSSTVQSCSATGEHPVDDPISQLSPLTSVPSFADTQAGPRPPPWGSYENLELQRRDRGDAREREDARRFRFTTDSGSSISKGSDSTSGSRENVARREVQDYREQVLRLYPEMEFDGTAGKGARNCCCAVM